MAGTEDAEFESLEGGVKVFRLPSRNDASGAATATTAAASTSQASASTGDGKPPVKVIKLDADLQGIIQDILPSLLNLKNTKIKSIQKMQNPQPADDGQQDQVPLVSADDNFGHFSYRDISLYAIVYLPSIQ